MVVLACLIYGIYGLWSGHFRRNLFPKRSDWKGRAYCDRIVKYMRRERPDRAEESTYNVLQRTAYLVVIAALFPLSTRPLACKQRWMSALSC